MQKLIFLNRCYWPDSEATGQLLTDLAESLTGQFDVHVVCGQPNSPTTDDYRRRGIETRNAVTIHRIGHTTFAKRIPAGRIVNLLTFTLAAKRYLQRCDLKADLIVSETDPFLLPIVAAEYARRQQAKFVAYLQDIYPDVAEAVGKAKSGRTTDSIRNRLRESYRQADRIVVLGDCMGRRLIAPPWNVPAEKIQVIPNWADCEKIGPIDPRDSLLRSSQNWQDRFVVMHSGNMGMTQRLENLIAATHSPTWPDNAVLAIVGDGASREKLLHLAATAETPNRIVFLPYQPREQLSDSLSAANIHVVSMDEAITGCLCPSKLYGILAAGRPILAVCSANTDLATIVRAHHVGFVVPTESPELFAKAVAESFKLYSDMQEASQFNDSQFNDSQFNDSQLSNSQFAAMGRHARALAVNQYDRPIVFAKIRQLFTDLLGSA